MRLRVLTAMFVSAAVVAGCGSSSSTGTSPPAAAVTHTATRTVTRAASTNAPGPVSSSSSSSSSSSTSSSATGSDDCVAADLRLSFLGGQGATGHGELGFALRNTSDQRCATGGYPGVLFLDKAGHGLTTTPTHTTDDFFGHTMLAPLTLNPGQTASFRLGVTHVGTGGSDAGCTTAAGLQVIAPNDTATMRLTLPDGGVAECRGTVTVSPLQPGTSALR